MQLHDSQIRPKSSFAFMQQRVLIFGFNTVFSKKNLKLGRTLQDL